jgi:hypothetical protein
VVQFPVGAKDFSLYKLRCGNRTTSYTIGTEGCFPGIIGHALEPDHSPSCNVEVKNGGATRLLSNTNS